MLFTCIKCKTIFFQIFLLFINHELINASKSKWLSNIQAGKSGCFQNILFPLYMHKMLESAQRPLEAGRLGLLPWIWPLLSIKWTCVRSLTFLNFGLLCLNFIFCLHIVSDRNAIHFHIILYPVDLLNLLLAVIV